MIPTAVLTISDSAHQGTRADVSGPKVAERLSRKGFCVVSTQIVPDDQVEIADTLRQIADAGEIKAIFTTGGTGITPRDVTPEATRQVIDREIPGLAELMRLKGRESTPYAVLSRAIAGNRAGVLIINLPGSPKGAVESLDAILDLVPHVLDLINGRTGH
jgi:molybdenum cofactor synthesis domain-containing protein